MKKIGKCIRQIVDGVPPIKYGWVDKKNRKVFYSLVGGHIKLKTNDKRIIPNLTNRLNRDIASLTRDMLSHTRFSIVDIDIPTSITNTLRGHIGIDSMIHSTVDVSNETIELFNTKIVDILLSYDDIEVYSTNKY